MLICIAYAISLDYNAIKKITRGHKKPSFFYPYSATIFFIVLYIFKNIYDIFILTPYIISLTLVLYKREFAMLKHITLKNEIPVTLKRIRAKDYDEVMNFLELFSHGKGAIWTYQYPNRPKKDKEACIKQYESDTDLFLGVWHGSDLIATSSIHLQHINHPWQAPHASFVICIQDEYTNLGLGMHLLTELEKWAMNQGVHRIHATVRHNNRQALGLYLKKGYQIEGIAKETAFFDNQWQHEYYIAKIIASPNKITT